MLAFLLLGCSEGLYGKGTDTAEDSSAQPSESECCEPSRYSTGITVVNDQGRTDIGPLVTYSHDGSPSAEALCGRSLANGACIYWAAGFEETGTFTITASAEGHTTVTEEVVVGLDEDGCHVDHQYVDIMLPTEEAPI